MRSPPGSMATKPPPTPMAKLQDDIQAIDALLAAPAESHVPPGAATASATHESGPSHEVRHRARSRSRASR